jgi:hypothetical protein
MSDIKNNRTAAITGTPAPVSQDANDLRVFAEGISNQIASKNEKNHMTFKLGLAAVVLGLPGVAEIISKQALQNLTPSIDDQLSRLYQVNSQYKEEHKAGAAINKKSPFSGFKSP